MANVNFVFSLRMRRISPRFLKANLCYCFVGSDKCVYTTQIIIFRLNTYSTGFHGKSFVFFFFNFFRLFVVFLLYLPTFTANPYEN